MYKQHLQDNGFTSLFLKGNLPVEVEFHDKKRDKLGCLAILGAWTDFTTEIKYMQSLHWGTDTNIKFVNIVPLK